MSPKRLAGLVDRYLYVFDESIIAESLIEFRSVTSRLVSRVVSGSSIKSLSFGNDCHRVACRTIVESDFCFDPGRTIGRYSHYIRERCKCPMRVIRTSAASTTNRRGASGLSVTSRRLRTNLRLCHTTSSTARASERNLLERTQIGLVGASTHGTGRQN